MTHNSENLLELQNKGKYLDCSFCAPSWVSRKISQHSAEKHNFMTKLSSQKTTYATDDNIFIVSKIFYFILLTATLYSKDFLHNLLLLFECLTYTRKNIILADIILVAAITLSEKNFQFSQNIFDKKALILKIQFLVIQPGFNTMPYSIFK